jgi:hypothetical protein
MREAFLRPRIIGDFLRRYTDRREFLRSLARGSYDYLFIGRGIPSSGPLREERWAESAGYEEVAQSERLTLLRAPHAFPSQSPRISETR